jgi:hypothetical protein
MEEEAWRNPPAADLFHSRSECMAGAPTGKERPYGGPPEVNDSAE